LPLEIKSDEAAVCVQGSLELSLTLQFLWVELTQLDE
jgi:hypothetical protein